MAMPDVVTREEWLEQRAEFLVKEKEATRERDRLNADRRRLPMVKVDKEYTFEGPDGPVALADLFDGRSQLILQHVMYDPSWENACPGCTASVDEVADGMVAHLNARDTTFVLVSRAPYEKLVGYAAKRGWTVPWYSSFGTDFNYDFQATVERGRQTFYNYRDASDELDDDEPSEMPGLSCFLKVGDDIFHTYSTWARGTDTLGGSYSLLDLTALGRQEDWEEPKGRAERVHGPDPSFKD